MNWSCFSIRSLEIALNNWDRRKYKLIQAWCDTVDPMRKHKASRLIRLIEGRIRSAMIDLFDKKGQYATQKIIEGDRPILLECTNIDCKNHPSRPEALLVGIPYKDYNPGAYYCGECGTALINEDEERAIELLWDFGINL